MTELFYRPKTYQNAWRARPNACPSTGSRTRNESRSYGLTLGRGPRVFPRSLAPPVASKKKLHKKKTPTRVNFSCVVIYRQGLGGNHTRLSSYREKVLNMGLSRRPGSRKNAMSLLMMSIVAASRSRGVSSFASLDAQRVHVGFVSTLGRTLRRKPALGQSATYLFSSSPSKLQEQSLDQTSKKNNNNNKKSTRLSNTGGLRRLPVVKSPIELMDKARKVPKRVKNDLYVPSSAGHFGVD